MAKKVVYDSIDSPNISQRRNARAETAPVLVDEEEEEASVVSEQHEVPYHLVQYSTVQYSTARGDLSPSTVQYSTVQYSTARGGLSPASRRPGP